MKFTGERFVPSEHGVIRHEHLHRYAACLGLARDRRVLDVACGEGFGSAMLATAARQVVGIDLAPDAINHASRHYAGRPPLSFCVGSADAIPLRDASIDLAVSFETIEHVERQEAMLAELKRVLAPEGILVMSSPDKRVFSDLTGHRNPFHVRELYLDEFEALLAHHFRHVRTFGQRMVAGSLLYPLQPTPGDHGSLVSWWGNTVAGHHQAPSWKDPVYAVSICSDAPLPVLPPSLFADCGDDVFDDMQRALRERQGEAGADPGAPGSAAHALAVATSELREARDQSRRRDVEIARLEQALAVLGHEVRALRNSRSWRLTVPLRALGAALRRAIGLGTGER